MTAILAPTIVFKDWDGNGQPLAFGTVGTYQAGTLVPQATYVDSTQTTPNTNPITLNNRGEANIWLNPLLTYKFIVLDSAGRQIRVVDQIQGSLTYSQLVAILTQSFLGQILYPRYGAEISTSVTPTAYQYDPFAAIDVLRYGIVPNSTGARAANTAILKALLNPAATGPTGRFVFPNITGADTYYFDAVFIPIRDGCRLDGCGCAIDFAGAFSLSNDFYGFFTFIRDVTIENMSINVNYNGTGGTSNGMIFRIGGRIGYNFNNLFNTSGEETFSPLMGNITLRNLRLATNNAAPLFANLLLGGLTNVLVENVVLNGQSVMQYGFWYEFGDWHYEATVANRKTSHANAMKFVNCYGKSMKNSVGGSFLQIVGANPCVVENIYVDTCFSAVSMSCGEALFYNVGAPFVLSGSSKTRWHTLTNVTAENCASNALNLVGSQSAAGGYLAGAGLTDSQQCDLQGFIINNPTLDDSISVNGPFILNGGTVRNGGPSGGVIIGQDCLSGEINGTQILDAGNEGIRADTTDTIRSGGARNKRLIIRGTKVCGSNFGGAGAVGIGLGTCDYALIQGCQLGYSTLYDNANEATQTFGVSADATTSNIILDGNYCKVASGNAYNKTSGPAGSTFISGRGTATLSGEWQYGGPRVLSTVTYSASMTPDCTQGNEFIITATNGTAFTINAPLNPLQTLIDITIRNNAGGALGAATFNGVFKLGAAWTQPANGFSRTVTFRWNAANWVEVGRTAADVAN